MKIVDLTVPIGEETLSPPSVNLQLDPHQSSSWTWFLASQ